MEARAIVRYCAQALLYLPFIAVIGYFSTRPAFEVLPPDRALVRLSLTHAAQRLVECRERTPAELAKLPPNMRAPLDCPRERAPVTVELEIDGVLVAHAHAAPSGLTRDGAGTVYRRLPVAAGKHHLVARLRDRAGDAFNYVSEADLDLAAGRVLVIDFHAGRGGFEFRQ